ncbi:ferritin [Candidatus Bathyarchaeota archaeon]|nr:ferritin [Candidatus Bathyarchaeota archaeon]
MASERLLALLNRAVSKEVEASIKYMWHHVLIKGVQGAAVKDLLRKLAIAEMKHAEAIARRLAYLGGTPTTKTDSISMGESFEDMLRSDLNAEEEAIALYKVILRVADDDGDITTMRLFEEILAEEEGHHNTLIRLMNRLQSPLTTRKCPKMPSKKA